MDRILSDSLNQRNDFYHPFVMDMSPAILVAYWLIVFAIWATSWAQRAPARAGTMSTLRGRHHNTTCDPEE
jgi:hypothetical protein